MGCGAPDQSATLPAGTDLSTETVLAGRVLAGGEPVAGAYVRLLDGTGEFTAEVVASADGDFRFFAAPGTWTVRALSRSGNGQSELRADAPGLHRTEIAVG
ncbi:DUF1416 domain-containing protein [Pseudonocardia sp.]|uniref:DUF1416 domain-containing protein n=1 Tax=Pseudonocardia sp. TaxID=60912 RepID=UPI00260A39FB|nr:DUF1416 domain-containing protein [Pseudonocardia sp.]